METFLLVVKLSRSFRSRLPPVPKKIAREDLKLKPYTAPVSEICGEIVMSGSDNTLQVRSFHIQEDRQFQVSAGGEDKKKKVPRIFGWGLRRFSTIVCEKIEAKGRTTYKKVSEEILSDINCLESSSQQIEFDEKNLRRRIYDAFNVLESIGIIARDKKEVWWIGFPHTKSEYVQRLQYLDLRNLASRNQKSERPATVSSGVALPFLLIKTSPLATVEIDISEDTRLVHFEFNGTPFTMHDDASVLKAMRFQAEGRPENVDQIILDGSHLMSPSLQNTT
ncbi:transcription factor-like protein DPB isoform X2 [Carex rostrata]